MAAAMAAVAITATGADIATATTETAAVPAAITAVAAMDSRMSCRRRSRRKKVPEDYVDEAERIMRSLMSQPKKVTNSKIRNLLSLVTDIYNEENIRTEEKLRPESVVKLNLMRVRVAYECGRDDTVKSFVARTNLLEYLKGISTDRADLIRFAHYMEALVAFHRYFGGKEG